MFLAASNEHLFDGAGGQVDGSDGQNTDRNSDIAGLYSLELLDYRCILVG